MCWRVHSAAARRQRVGGAPVQRVQRGAVGLQIVAAGLRQADKQSAAFAALQQPFLRHLADGLVHGGPVHAKLLGQRQLGGQGCTGRQAAVDDGPLNGH